MNWTQPDPIHYWWTEQGEPSEESSYSGVWGLMIAACVVGSTAA
jgi:hypothetical protein